MPLGVATSETASAFTAKGVNTGRRVYDFVDIVDFHGIKVTSAERTCFELMSRSVLVEAVVFADAFLHMGLDTQRGLARYADERPHWPHVRKIRTAVLLSHSGAESPMETRLRMVIVLAGLPEPLVNVPLHDGSGRFLGRPDLLYLHPLFGIEYDGRYHDDDQQRERDGERENALLVGRVPLLRYGSTAVYRRPQLIVSEVEAMRARGSAA